MIEYLGKARLQSFAQSVLNQSLACLRGEPSGEVKPDLAGMNVEAGAFCVGRQDAELVLSAEKANTHTGLQACRVNRLVMPGEIQLLDDPVRFLFDMRAYGRRLHA